MRFEYAAFLVKMQMGENLDCYLDDDGGPEVQAVEAADSNGHRQSLHVRVGSVFYGKETAREPGVWIELQEEHNKTLPQGPILLTPEVWRQVNKAVEWRLQRRLPLWKRVIIRLCG